jgi:hypothetical protein
MSDDLIDVDLIGTAIRGLVKGEPDFEIEVDEDCEIIGKSGADTIVRYKGNSYALDAISGEIESEILTKINKHKQVVRSLQQSKYVDPDTNPVIRFDTDED